MASESNKVLSNNLAALRQNQKKVQAEMEEHHNRELNNWKERARQAEEKMKKIEESRRVSTGENRSEVNNRNKPASETIAILEAEVE